LRRNAHRAAPRGRRRTRALGSTLEHARTLIELGAALPRSGYRADAREPLTTGHELAYECGARALAQRARQELIATGYRPTRARLAGRDALTASELRVAGMAADGATNREIAQSLYLSVKTVEMHVSRAYRKLGISSRHDLAAAVTSSGAHDRANP
jgi:DNA-binding CsgD family transcriptional regulator